MTIEAINWAWKMPVRPASAKLTLVALADHANKDAEAWPSVKALCVKTSLDRKTVISAIQILEIKRCVADTGKRMGRTAQIKVYRVGNDPEFGTVPFSERYRILPERVPQTEHGTHRTITTPSSDEDGVEHVRAQENFSPPRLSTNAASTRKPSAQDFGGLNRFDDLMLDDDEFADF
jgi:hypothetical protein